MRAGLAPPAPFRLASTSRPHRPTTTAGCPTDPSHRASSGCGRALPELARWLGSVGHPAVVVGLCGREVLANRKGAGGASPARILPFSFRRKAISQRRAWPIVELRQELLHVEKADVLDG